MSSDSEDEIVAGGSGGRRQLRRRGAAAAGSTLATGGGRRRLRDDDDSEDSGSDIEQAARRKKGKKIPLPEDDEAGPSGTHQQRGASDDSSEWESDWNSDEEKLLKQGGQKAAEALVSKLGYASDSSTSSGDGDKCPICLLSLNDQEVGVPEVCDHMFCAPCIEEWAKNVTTCPIDRKNFDAINVYKSVDRKQLVRKNQVQTKPADDVPVLEDHELTYCEVCRRPDREDTMLLCDSCNLGFHMECLNPPLEQIPIGSWYCDCCFASGSEEDDEEVNDLLNDLNEIGGMRQTRLRDRMSSPPRIVRTRQSERIRSAILTRTSTTVRLNVVEDQQPGPSTRRSANSSSTAAATRAPAKSVRKRRKRRTRRKILRMIISEYDVNNDDEKFAVRRKKIYKTLKRLSKKRSKRKRTSRGSRSKRESAGLTPGMEEGAAELQRQRFSTGIPTLKIFGGANDLDYFSDDDAGQEDLEADVSIGGRGETAVQSVRAAIRNPLARRRALKSGFEPSSSTGGPVDLLGSIMENQTRWHSKQGTKDAKIDNGKIIFQAEVPSKKVPGATQAGLGQNSQQGNVSVPAGSSSSAGAADSTSASHEAGGASASSSGAAEGTSAAGASGNGGDGRGGDNFDPLDTSMFVDLPPLTGKDSEKDKNKKDDADADPMDTSMFVDLPPVGDKDKKKKSDAFDMFGTDSPIPLPPQSPPAQAGAAATTSVPLNPAPEISTTTSDADSAGPGTSRGFGKFKFTMTSESNNCPNMSMYSSETLEYTKSGGEEPYDPMDSEQKTDDESGERDEDLVQLDDEDPVEPAQAKPDQEGIPNGTDKLPTGDPDHDAFDSDSEDELKKIEEVSGGGPEPEPSTELEALTPPLTTTVAAALVTSSTAVTTMAAPADAATTSVASSIDEAPAPSSAQGEEDRSYTPCLDEKYQEARREHDRSGTTPDLPPMSSPKEGIDGMDTELISEEDENTFKEDETAAASTSKATSSGARKKDLTFKKVNKKGKERNYRGDKEHKKKDRTEDKENDSRRSRERERDRNRARRPRRKELARYDVRTVIAQKPAKPAKDPFGRDVTPKPPSKRGSRSRSRTPPPERRREPSISLSPEPPRRYNRRRSVSPRFRSARNRTPPTFFRRSRSPEGIRGIRMRSISRSRSPMLHRHRNPSRSVSRSPYRDPNARSPKSRSPSPQMRVGKTKKIKKKKQRPAASISRSRSPSEGRGKKKSKKSRKKKNKHRGGDRAVSPSGGSAKKKKNRRRSVSPMISPSRSRSGSIIPAQTTGVLTERFAKVRQQNSWTPPPPTRPKTNGTNLTVILTNEEALSKQAKERERKRKEARRRERARDKNLPSKEVFTSGDNILVSVSFNDKNLNKENQQAAAGGEGEVSAAVAQKRMKDMAKKRAEAEKAKRKRLERLKKTRGEAPKPVVIIDLDRSPFRVLTPSPRAVIVLSDSDTEKDKSGRREGAAGVANGQQSSAEASANGGGQSASQRKSPAERHEEDMFGPKTPPGFPSQPQSTSQSKPQAPKFTMQVKSKSTNLRPLNPLYEPGELDEGKTPERMDNAESSNYNMVGPNTPPEPAPQSPSPDVYDPFEPTKSPSPSPSRRDNASIERLSDLDDAVLPSSSGKVDGPDSGGAGGDPKADSQNQDEAMNGEQEPAPRGNKITILSNIVISQPTNSGQGVVSGSGVSASQNNNTGDDSDVIFDDFVSSSAPAPSNNVGYSTSSSNPIKSYSTAANSSSLISKLPLPPGAAAGQKFSDFINPTDSPYSPGASDFDDLFEPGGDLDSPPAAPTKQSYKPTKIPTKGAKKGGGGGGGGGNSFDNLFGGSPANNFKRTKKGGHKRRGKPKGDDEEDLSKLSTKERFLKKLNRLERVVEEVKLVIKPFYNKKQINKEEYKDILRRAVPKICHSRTGEINPIKIQKLIKAYVHKVRARRRLAKKAGGAGGAGGPVGLPGININPMII